ncbi:MAG: MazG-like family protein [Desulfuromonas sp.]|nr:MazG-like family protein [Desulfuromonas sp.]
MLTFEQFQTNVQQWSTARGIYEHSGALAQALKAVSEVGELADATIKNDLDALKDAIGDVAVCLVNVASMTDSTLDEVYIFDDVKVERSAPQIVAHVSYMVAHVSLAAAESILCEPIDDALNGAFYSLYATANVNNLDFLDCCSAAWDEIKDRTGHMVAGGAFVKDE